MGKGCREGGGEGVRGEGMGRGCREGKRELEKRGWGEGAGRAGGSRRRWDGERVQGGQEGVGGDGMVRGCREGRRESEKKG
ncbi:hypothetical protein EYF80_058289 [Liparis tanakae]|uniref:Uncharacterized protein n=1 Tax=Liparis tanakae TaxID=230148 RepID=A0A4Z2ERX4_9TELE|nr:hypothetical protein EYF80_058289 [Liparis tanakae]